MAKKTTAETDETNLGSVGQFFAKHLTEPTSCALKPQIQVRGNGVLTEYTFKRKPIDELTTDDFFEWIEGTQVRAVNGKPVKLRKDEKKYLSKAFDTEKAKLLRKVAKKKSKKT